MHTKEKSLPKLTQEEFQQNVQEYDQDLEAKKE